MPMGSTVASYQHRTCDMCECTDCGAATELADRGWKMHGKVGALITLCGDCERLMAERRQLASART